MVPDSAKIPYFRTKVLELLVCLSVIEANNITKEGPYFYKDKVEKTRAVQKLISENIDQEYTIKWLAERFDISQTALKDCFKSLYEKPIYTWLKEYRIEKAKEEIALMREYDYAIVNDHVPLAAERVKRVIEAEHFRVIVLSVTIRICYQSLRLFDKL